MSIYRNVFILVAMSVFLFPQALQAAEDSPAGGKPKVMKLADGFIFTEGPAADTKGNVYFTDIPNNRIHKWSVDGKLTTYRENSGGANGLMFDSKGNLYACEGGNRRLTMTTPDGNLTVLADKHGGKKLNRPKEAIDDFTSSLRFFRSWYVLFERCRLYNQIKRYDDAIRDCRAALAMNKTFYDVWWPLGNAYYQKKDFRSALDAYSRYQQNAEKTPEFMQQRIRDLHSSVPHRPHRP